MSILVRHKNEKRHRDHLKRASDKTIIPTIYRRHFLKLGFKNELTFFLSKVLKLAIYESHHIRIFKEYGLILIIVEDYAIVLDGAKSVWNGSFQNLSDNDCIKIELRKENSVVHECLLMFQIPYETPYQAKI